MSATDSTRRTPLRRAKSSRDAGVSPGRDGMLFAESVVTLASASRLLQSLALHSLARTRRHHVGSIVQTDSAVARSRRLVGSPIPRSVGLLVNRCRGVRGWRLDQAEDPPGFLVDP